MIKYDIIIIGAGPAGMTAAIYGLRASKKVLILEARSYGGQIVNASVVENYPGISSINGFDLATNMYNQVKNLGGEIIYEAVVRINEDKSVITSNNTYYGKSIIIATGVSSRKLMIENEEKLVGHGVSYCATCDGNFYKDKVVAVVGGGNTALEDAKYLADISREVYIIHRRDEFRGDNIYFDELKKCNNVKFVMNSNVVKLNGSDKLESIDVKDKDGNVSTIVIDGLFIAVGQSPNNLIFNNIIEMDDKGYIISSDGVHTNIDKIYVAGDARVKNLRQLTTAVGDGANAATIAIREMED